MRYGSYALLIWFAFFGQAAASSVKHAFGEFEKFSCNWVKSALNGMIKYVSASEIPKSLHI